MPKVIRDEDVYQSTIEVVLKRGYTGATTKQIADAASISEVTLFRRYGNKAELVRRAIAALVEEVDLDSACRYSGDIFCDLRCVVAGYQEAATKNKGFYITVLSEIPRHPELADLVGMPLRMLGGIGELIRRYQQEGVLVEEPPLNAVSALLGPLIITNMMRSAGPDESLPEIDLEQHVRRYLDGRRGHE